MRTDRSLDVSERAYAIWEQMGCPEGKALDNWLQAEAEFSETAVRQQKSGVRNIVPKKQHGRRKGWVKHLLAVGESESTA
jgi:hypothetical protein